MTDDDLERQLRHALQADADRIHPADRWEAIHSMSQQQRPSSAGHPRWLAPVAAAAAVAVIAGGAWALTRGGGSTQGAPAATSSSATTATSSPTSSPTTARGAVATAGMALPAYFVGPNGGNGDRWALYREFLPSQLPGDAGDSEKAKAAVALAMNAEPFSNTDGYLQPWSGTQVTDVAVSPTSIRITVSNKGADGFVPEQTRLAVQELVWTAQAAVGKGTIPVTFAIADGSTALFGRYPAADTYNRPATDKTYQDLATLWITSPGRDQVLPADKAVVVKGESCSFEGTSQWQLKQGSTVVRSGSSHATSGCPTRGTWQVSLGTLAPGDYTFRAYEVSMENGQKTVGDTSRGFTVR